MTLLLLYGLIISVCINAFFIHYLYVNKLEVSFVDHERKELEILQIAIEKINGVERSLNENPEIAYKQAKGIARKAIDDIISHRSIMK
jgi:hypothetical protein